MRGQTNRRVKRKAARAAKKPVAQRAAKTAAETRRPRRRRTRILRRAVNRRMDPEASRRRAMLVLGVAGRVAALFGLFIGFTAAGLGMQSGYRELVHSESFAIQQIDIGGNVHLTREEILDEMRVRMGEPLLELDVSALQTQLALHPWVRTAEVTRRLPDRLVVEIVERQPHALVALENLYLMDGDGDVFKRLDRTDMWDLPVISGLLRDDLRDEPQRSRSRLTRGLELIERAEQAGLGERVRISEVHLARTSEVLVLESGTRAHLPDGDPGPALKRLDSILEDLAQRGQRARVVFLDDERDPKRVTVRVAPSRKRGEQG